MDKELFELDWKERQPPNAPLGEPQHSRRQTPVHTRRRSHRRSLNILPLVISLLALIISIAALILALSKDKEEEPDISPNLPTENEPVTFRFGDRVLTPLEGMPLNLYDKDAFRVDERGRITYESDGQKAKTGVDVSTHQGDIDWQAVAADGIDFAILRLGNRGYTEGGLFLDQTFEQNLRGALEAGLEVGIYFFSQAVTPEEAEEEANYILDILDGQKLAFPVAFDWEFISEEDARNNSLDGEGITRCAVAFCERIEEAGYRPAVYFNRTQGYLFYDLLKLKDYQLWLAEYNTTPDFYYHCDLWQYSDRGRVNGIQGSVDLDLSF